MSYSEFTKELLDILDLKILSFMKMPFAKSESMTKHVLFLMAH